MKRTTSNLSRHELIGLETEVTNSDCKSFVGLKGVIIDETKNTLEIRTDDGDRTVPKKGKTFAFNIEDKNTTIQGNVLIARPQDRTKTR